MIKHKLCRHYDAHKQAHNQKGATLVTVLVFLTLMTIISVSATKISMIDVLASGNEQQLVLLSQQTENDLKGLTRVVKLYVPLTELSGAKFADDTGIYKFPVDAQKPHDSQKITDKKKDYYCGGFNGKAASIGPSISRCYLYDFEVKKRGKNSAGSDTHNRGAGKEKPSTKKNSYL